MHKKALKYAPNKPKILRSMLKYIFFVEIMLV